MESSKEYLQNLKNLFDNTKNRKNWMVLLLVSIIAVILYSILAFVSKKINLNKRNCKNIKKTYTEFPLITSVNPSDIKDDYGLRDFYVKSADLGNSRIYCRGVHTRAVGRAKGRTGERLHGRVDGRAGGRSRHTGGGRTDERVDAWVPRNT